MRIAADVAVMRESDRLTIQKGTPGTELMMRAGKGIFESRPLCEWGKTAVVCGTGNNAGDGYVLALLLSEAGCDVKIFLTQEKFSPDGRFYFEKCLEKGVAWEIISSETSFYGYDTIADCIFGTGFRGVPDGNELCAIRKINTSGAFVVSADINSGLCGQSGICDGECVSSDLTVSIGSYKPGHFLGDAKDKIAALTNIDIGIELCGPKIFVPEKDDFHDVFFSRKRNCHKGDFGYVAIIGGCMRYLGAAKLSNLALSALKCGCGVAKLCTPASLAASVTPYLVESTFFPMPDRDGEMIFSPGHIDELCRGTRAISVGMGWGSGEDNQKILSYLLSEYPGTLIIDADGLNALSRMGGLAFDFSCKKVILTPHPLEFSRISGLSIREILEDPIKAAYDFAAKYDQRVILLLKGAATVITDGEKVYISDSGSAAMATAGSGDVLSGALAGIMGFCEPSPLSVACGAFTVGLAGELAGKNIGEISATSRDTVDFIAQAVKMLAEK